MKTLLIVLLTLLSEAVHAPPIYAGGRCTGSLNCTACSNCSGCQHCAKGGGSCGVCSNVKKTIGTVFGARPVATAAPQVIPKSAPKQVYRSTPRQAQASPTLNAAAGATTTAGKPVSGNANITVYFSPKGGCTEAIVKEINGAKHWIRVQAYGFTSPPILDALKKAHQRGVKVKLVLDKSNATAKYSGATFMANAGVPVLIDDKHAIAHSKVIVIDGDTSNATLITGSFNFSQSAEERNAENLLVIKNADAALLNAYADDFKRHEAHSKLYQRLDTP